MARYEISFFPETWGEFVELACLLLFLTGIPGAVALGHMARFHVALHVFWVFWAVLAALESAHLVRRAGHLLGRCPAESRVDLLILAGLKVAGFLSALCLFFHL